MSTVSACLIAHNEAGSLARTLDSLAWTDEIIVVDCGSTDATARIARERGCTVLERSNEPNLNVNKNVSFDAARSTWILCIDADEVIPPATADEVRRVVACDPPEQGFFLKRRNNYFGRFLRHGGHYPDKQLRLFRRGTARFGARHVHERLQVEGRIGMLTHPFDHYPYPTMARMIEKMNFYTDFEADYLYARGVRFCGRHFAWALVRAHMRFFRRYVLKLGFLDGVPGYAAALLDFCTRVASDLKLRDRCRADAAADDEA